MLKRIKLHLPTIISVVLTVVILIAALMWFRTNVSVIAETSSESFLSENTRALASVFGTKLDDQLIMLESQVRYFRDIDLSDYNKMKETIMSTKGIGAFKTIGVADSTGATVNYNGKTSGNILLTDVFGDTMAGSTCFSSTFIRDEDGEDVLVAAIPIIQQSTPVGIVYGTFSRSDLSSLLNIVSFQGRTTNFLLDEDGNVLAQSTDKSTIRSKVKNFFTEMDIQKPADGKEKVIHTRINGTESFAVIMPVGVHEWYFVSVMPYSVVDEQTGEISGNVAIVMIVVIFGFVLLFVSILYLIKNYEAITRSNEKFKLVTVESQDIIFDYEFKGQHLTLDGYTDNVIPDGRTSFKGSSAITLLDLIHSDDNAVCRQLMKLRSSSDTSIRGEFRILCLDGAYSWFRLKAVVVRQHDGTPQQMVGSLINVDDQMNKDFRLIEKAETDPLTGILSKDSFRGHVLEKLSEASDSDLFALYIIDIDTFKKVNDSLGHTMGDQVLSDVAKKLCVVFSDKDYVGRVGGDEFAAFLRLPSKARSVGMNLIEDKAKAICYQLRETYRAKKKEVDVTASVGVAIYPYAARTYDDLHEKAFIALESVKEAGMNRYSIYSPEMHDNEQRKKGEQK
ncbi:MAG: diguanylate cyclase [Ruminiclostridium sp.]|nr:diguanylate cyclase [Ruminiclostridium sp.]